MRVIQKHIPAAEPMWGAARRYAIKGASLTLLFGVVAITATSVTGAAVSFASIAAVGGYNRYKHHVEMREVMKALEQASRDSYKEMDKNQRKVFKYLQREIQVIAQEHGLTKPILIPKDMPAATESDTKSALFFDLQFLSILKPREIQALLRHEITHLEKDHVVGNRFFNFLSSAVVISFLAGFGPDQVFGQGKSVLSELLGGNNLLSNTLNVGARLGLVFGYLRTNKYLSKLHSRTSEFECDAAHPHATGEGISIITSLSKVILSVFVNEYNADRTALRKVSDAEARADAFATHPSDSERVQYMLELTSHKIKKDNPEMIAELSKINIEWLARLVEREGLSLKEGADLEIGAVTDAFDKLVHSDAFDDYLAGKISSTAHAQTAAVEADIAAPVRSTSDVLRASLMASTSSTAIDAHMDGALHASPTPMGKSATVNSARHVSPLHPSQLRMGELRTGKFGRVEMAPRIA